MAASSLGKSLFLASSSAFRQSRMANASFRLSARTVYAIALAACIAAVLVLAHHDGRVLQDMSWKKAGKKFVWQHNDATDKDEPTDADLIPPQPDRLKDEDFDQVHGDDHAQGDHEHYPFGTTGRLPCHGLPGAEEVLVITKSGATEFEAKFPMHVNTTLRCYPHYLVFSDHSETFEGIEILDSFSEFNDTIRQSHPDFEIWRRVKKGGGRSTLKQSELAGPWSAVAPGGTGKPDNPGWNQDKWKNIPTALRALKEYPDMKWYVFIEVDTVMMWQTLLNYLRVLDHTQPLYLGNQIFAGEVMFAHGGTGYVMSRPALKAAVEKYHEDPHKWDRMPEELPFGDACIGHLLVQAGAISVSGFPIFQGEQVATVPYDGFAGNGQRVWCSPTVTYHHVPPLVVKSMWEFEQRWMQKNADNPTAIMKHKDVFTEYVLPHLPQENRNFSRLGWNNHADQDQGYVETLGDCRTICEKSGKCVQFAIDLEKRCLTAERPSLGEYARGYDSGWVMSRVHAWVDMQEECPDGDGWMLP